MTHDPEPVESPAGTTPETCVLIPQTQRHLSRAC